MKTIQKLFPAALALLCSLAAARAQTFAGGIPVTGTTNAPLYVNGVIPTNTWYFQVPAKPVTLGGVTDTNEVVVFSYGVRVVGGTNVVILASLTNSFAAGTNGGTWVTNVPAQAVAVSFIPYAQVAVGDHTNTIYVP